MANVPQRNHYAVVAVVTDWIRRTDDRAPTATDLGPAQNYRFSSDGEPTGI